MITSPSLILAKPVKTHLGKQVNHFLKALLAAEVKPDLEAMRENLQKEEAKLKTESNFTPSFRMYDPAKASLRIAQSAFQLFKLSKHKLKAAT